MQHISTIEKSTPPLAQEFLKILYQTMTNAPEDLLNREFLIELDNISGYKGKTNIYVEKRNKTVNSIENNHIGKHKNSSNRYNPFSSWNFYFSDGSPGKLTLLIFDPQLMKGIFLSGGVALLMAIGALILTNGLLSWFVAKSIITPLKILERSALNIKNEDLDTPVTYSGKDEFLHVCVAFEEMRLRLKDSLLERLKYEENRKELLSNISHDLKTPITAIKGYVEGIKDGIADTPEKMERYIDTVYSKSVLMNDLIDRLFLFSKLDLGRIQFNFQNIDINTFLKDIFEELKFDYSKMQLQMDLPMKKIPITADPIHLHRVLVNLVDNALKYSGRDRTIIIVSLTEMDHIVEIALTDNGVGISEESLPRIFERFYRSDPARSSLIEGSGLGLSISSQIIKAHGGEMSAESLKNQGTTIRFSLRKKL